MGGGKRSPILHSPFRGSQIREANMVGVEVSGADELRQETRIASYKQMKFVHPGTIMTAFGTILAALAYDCPNDR